ncbi:hypothetical protein J6Z48_01370, partial [bacterium]|nr:hypothetical protein [bacterium]
MAGKKILVLVLSILCVSLLSYSTYKLIREGKYKGGLIAKVFNPEGLLDDWIYSPSKNVGKGMYSLSSINKSTSSYDSFAANESTTGTIGFSTGGAKDINNYRDNLKEGYFPLLTDITYEGLFYDYYFDTSTTSVESNNTDSLFIPTASTAVSADPVSGENDYYITVGLNSNIKLNHLLSRSPFLLGEIVILNLDDIIHFHDNIPVEG